jgi:hypothetical protein
VDASTGKVVQHWEAKKKAAASSGGGLADAIAKMKADDEKRKTLFQDTQKEIERKKREADAVFEKEKERIKRDKDVTRPPNPFDLD